MSAGVLDGARVLVTRPEERAEGLVREIEARGGVAVRWPAIAIEPVPREAVLHALSGRTVEDCAAVVFVSPAAVEHGAGPLGLTPEFPVPLAAVGRATAAALLDRGLEVAIEPAGSMDSEGLLRAPGLAAGQVAGKRVLIVRGSGGREALAAGLAERGAIVEYLEVYRRRRPAGLDGALAAGADIVTVTSSEGLENLLAGLGDAERAALLERPVATVGSRVRDAARRAGFRNRIIAAAGPDDASLAEAVVQLAPGARGAS